MHPFHLAVAFWVVASGICDVNTQCSLQLFKELRGELRSLVGMDSLWIPVSGKDLLF